MWKSRREVTDLAKMQKYVCRRWKFKSSPDVTTYNAMSADHAEFGAVHKCSNLIDSIGSPKMLEIGLLSLPEAPIQPRTGPDKFAVRAGLASPELGSFLSVAFDRGVRRRRRDDERCREAVNRRSTSK